MSATSRGVRVGGTPWFPTGWGRRMNSAPDNGVERTRSPPVHTSPTRSGGSSAVAFAPSAPLGVLLLGLVFAFGPVSSSLDAFGSTAVAFAGLLGAAAAFAALTAGELLAARRARRLDLTPG